MPHARGALLALAMTLAACAPVRHSPATRYQHILLNARDLGAEALSTEGGRDPQLRDYLAREGQPDFVIIGSDTDVQLVYVQPSRVVHFHRPAPGAPSMVQLASPIPSPLLHMLPRDLRAGTPQPVEDRTTACWTIAMPLPSCRTCCATRTSCVTQCR